ncbi:MAG: proteasome accessory factor PafA2 family protein [Fimbriimonadaceae bacterium]|nr:proteasome accessory factor PafA2 family protein [Fimbriimonadaceae bacterium]
MERILAGIETEYGLWIKGRGADSQVDDAMMLVRSYPGEHFASWDYRFESPRADLRGFTVGQLAYDPEDAKFDTGKSRGSDHEVRSDRILPNGARFYNDHGHPEYATPECFESFETALHDYAGQYTVLRAAKVFEREVGREVKVYKNNTDFHGASYGTHESFLVPRSLGFEKIYQSVLPMLVVRQILTGAGKVGSEHGDWVPYQISQRADFFVEPFNTETLYRRPIFNTRDEPHADPDKWIRLHVISGDANMSPDCSSMKLGLVKLALQLAIVGEAPIWKFKNPVDAFKRISRDMTFEFKIELDSGSWTTAYEVFESYFSAAEAVFDLPSLPDQRHPSSIPETPETEIYRDITMARQQLSKLRSDFSAFAKEVDWAAKKVMLEQIVESEGLTWRDHSLQAYDLEYHNVDPDEGLYFALREMGQVDDLGDAEDCLEDFFVGRLDTSRAVPRGIAVKEHKAHLKTASWRSLVFEVDGKAIEIELDPTRTYRRERLQGLDVVSFIQALRG